MAFERGKSGNPGGRPLKTEEQRRFENRCRVWADKNAFAKLEKYADSEDKDERKWALQEILNRGFGRPLESLEASHQVEGIRANPDEALSILEALIAGSTTQVPRPNLGDAGGAGTGADAIPDPERSPGENNP